VKNVTKEFESEEIATQSSDLSDVSDVNPDSSDVNPDSSDVNPDSSDVNPDSSDVNVDISGNQLTGLSSQELEETLKDVIAAVTKDLQVLID
jgi:hypothetical protein